MVHVSTYQGSILGTRAVSNSWFGLALCILRCRVRRSWPSGLMGLLSRSVCLFANEIMNVSCQLPNVQEHLVRQTNGSTNTQTSSSTLFQRKSGDLGTRGARQKSRTRSKEPGHLAQAAQLYNDCLVGLDFDGDDAENSEAREPTSRERADAQTRIRLRILLGNHLWKGITVPPRRVGFCTTLLLTDVLCHWWIFIEGNHMGSRNPSLFFFVLV